MPARLVYQPVVTVDSARMPLSATLVDPGRPPVETTDDDGNPITVPKTYVHVSAMGNGTPDETDLVRLHCLSLVAGIDMSNMDAENSIVTLFEAGTDQPLLIMRDWLGSTPAGLGWPNPRVNRLRTRINNAGGDTTGLSSSTPLWRWVNAVGIVFSSTWDIRQSMTSLPGA